MLIKQTKAFLSFLFFLNPSLGFAKTKICEIKYNEKGGIQALEAKINSTKKYKKVYGKNNFYCYKIGLEHDKNRSPLIKKPIYACCKDM